MIHMVGIEKSKPPLLANRGRTLDFHAVMYIARGEGYFEDKNTRRSAVGPGSFFYLLPGLWHNFDPLPGTTWDEYWLTFDGRMAEKCFGRILPKRSLHSAPVDVRVMTSYENLNRFQDFPAKKADVYRRSFFHEILSAFYLHFDPPPRTDSGDVVARARLLMGVKLSQKKLDWNRFCQRENLPYELFRKKFRAQTGFAPNQFFLNLKLSQAKEDLFSSNLSISEIASRCGFPSAAYFSRFFKEKTGQAPKLFRDRKS